MVEKVATEGEMSPLALLIKGGEKMKQLMITKGD